MGDQIRVEPVTLRQSASAIRTAGGRLQDGAALGKSAASHAATHAGHPAAQGAIDSFWGSWETALGSLNIHATGMAIVLAAAADGYEVVDTGNGLRFRKLSS
jgi:Excreted virulence factor EspC, type VII ESX diderm